MRTVDKLGLLGATITFETAPSTSEVGLRANPTTPLNTTNTLQTVDLWRSHMDDAKLSPLSPFWPGRGRDIMTEPVQNIRNLILHCEARQCVY